MDDLGKLWTIVDVERSCGCLLHIFRFDGFSPKKTQISAVVPNV